MSELRIFFVGSFENEWSTNHEMVKALKELGNVVYEFDYRINQINAEGTYKYINKFFSFLRRFPLIGHFSMNIYTQILDRDKVLKDLKNRVEVINPDLIFLCKTDTLNIDKLKKFKNKTCYYFMDPIKMARKIRTDLITQNCNFSIATFNYVSTNMIKSKYKRNNIQGVDTSKFKLVKEYKFRKDKIVFVANKTSKRNQIVKN